MDNKDDLDIYECDLCGHKKLIAESDRVYDYTCINKCFQGKKSYHEPYTGDGHRYTYFHVHEELNWAAYTDTEMEEIRKENKELH